MLDLQVDILMSRDLDSLINERESAAVTEWIKSPDALHVIRDHPLHKKEILGGLFGIKLGTIYHFLLVRDQSSITSSKRWVSGVIKWHFLLIYSTIYADVGGWVGLKKPKIC